MLDDFLLVQRTSEEDASRALAIDLRELALTEIGKIRSCRSLRLALLSDNALTAIDPSLLVLRHLQKLDLSRNAIASLPSQPADWARLASLQLLYLHSNRLESLAATAALGGLPTLHRLTLYDNTLAQHPNYRHYVVNSILSLRALDRHVISDEELIEGAQFIPRFGAMSPTALLEVVTHPPFAAPTSDAARLAEMNAELRQMNAVHARLSPVLIIQAKVRGDFARAQCKIWRLGRAASPPPPPTVIMPVASSTSLTKAYAASTIQAHARGKSARKKAKRQRKKPKDHLVFYVQTRHIEELKAILAGAHASCDFKPTSYFTIRHTTIFPASLAAPPLQGLVVRHPTQERLDASLRLSPTLEEAGQLQRLCTRFSTPLAAEKTAIHHALHLDSLHPTGVVAETYSRRQLISVTFSSPDDMRDTFEAIKVRNTALLKAMGVKEAAPQNPKVISELLMPLMSDAIHRVAAVVTLQRVWRSFRSRSWLRPSVAARLLALRAAVTMQRWWRWWLLKERHRMLLKVKERAAAASRIKLYLPTAVYEQLDGQQPLHRTRLWPEHTAFEFTFGNTPESPLQYFATQSEVRGHLPKWCAPAAPIAASRAVAPRQEPLSLLSAGVRAALAPRRSLGRFVRREWTMFAFHSTAEAARRSALLTALGYEPLAARTRHGRLQGRLVQPLQLVNHEELLRLEAACCVQAAWLAARARRATRPSLAAARQARGEAREEAEGSTSLLQQRGELRLGGTVARPPPRRAAAGGGAEAEALCVRGVPPVRACGAAEELEAQVARGARLRREASGVAAVEMERRRAEELRRMREMALGVAEEAGGSRPASARALMQVMLQMRRGGAAEEGRQAEAAEVAARLREEKAEVARRVRDERRKAQQELAEDRELEQKELMIQARIERHDLRFALSERKRADAVDVSRKTLTRKAQQARSNDVLNSRAFSSAFVRQQNTIARQMQLGELRRNRETQLQLTAALAEQQQRQEASWQSRYKASKSQRAVAVHHNVLIHKEQVANEIEKKQAEREQELELVRYKQKQLRDIRRMLNEPLSSMESDEQESARLSLSGLQQESISMSSQVPEV